MPQRRAVLPLIASAVLLAATVACKKDDEQPTPSAPAASTSAAGGEPAAPGTRAMTVSGEGFVTAKPDMAYVTAGVVTQGATAAEALAENTKRMTAVFELIKELGIAEKDIQTANFSVRPRYTVSDPTKMGSDSVIAGYDASNDVTVCVRDLNKLGAALDRFVSVAGANNLRGVSFDFANPDPLLDEARKKAVADAGRKAKLYAESAGLKLGPVQSLSESGAFYPKTGFVSARMEAMSAPVPMAPGESKITANVQVTYALE